MGPLGPCEAPPLGTGVLQRRTPSPPAWTHGLWDTFFTAISHRTWGGRPYSPVHHAEAGGGAEDVPVRLYTNRCSPIELDLPVLPELSVPQPHELDHTRAGGEDEHRGFWDLGLVSDGSRGGEEVWRRRLSEPGARSRQSSSRGSLDGVELDGEHAVGGGELAE